MLLSKKFLSRIPPSQGRENQSLDGNLSKRIHSGDHGQKNLIRLYLFGSSSWSDCSTGISSHTFFADNNSRVSYFCFILDPKKCCTSSHSFSTDQLFVDMCNPERRCQRVTNCWLHNTAWSVFDYFNNIYPLGHDRVHFSDARGLFQCLQLPW